MSKKLIRRMDHKRERSAVRQVIKTGHVRTVRPSVYHEAPTPLPIPDDAPSTGKRRSKRGCPKNKGGEHAWKYTKIFERQYGGLGYLCTHCKKQSWRRPPDYVEPVRPRAENWDHWTTDNILRRLAGGKCQCVKCTKEREIV